MEEQRLMVSDLEMTFSLGDYNIIESGVRTGKTFWSIKNNGLRQFTRDGNLSRILFMADTESLKESILYKYGDLCCEADDMWLSRSSWGEQPDKIGVMCYQKLASRVAMRQSQLITFLNEIDCICWDECDSIFEFAAQEFEDAITNDYPGDMYSQEEILGILMTYGGTKYKSIALLGFWEKLLVNKKIMCIGMSATPEPAKRFFKSLIHSANKGKLQSFFKLAEDLYFSDMRGYLNNLFIESGKGLWVCNNNIEENKRLAADFRARGYNVVDLNSYNNSKHPMDSHQRYVRDTITKTGMVPPGIDVVIVTHCMLRGFDLDDERFDNVIVNSYDPIVRAQAARNTFSYRAHYKTYIPPLDPYLDKWLTVSECREMAESLKVSDLDEKISRKLSWNKLKEALDGCGYKVESARKLIDKKRQICYRITGAWHDIEIKNKKVEELLKAKKNLDEGERKNG